MLVIQIRRLEKFAYHFQEDDYIECQIRRMAGGPGTVVITVYKGASKEVQARRWIDCWGKMYSYDPDPPAEQVVYWLKKYRKRGVMA